MKFKQNFDDKAVPYGGENLDPVSITETAGYIEPKIQIEQMILAGQRLAVARQELYDELNEDGEADIDPFRNPRLDMAEVSQMQIAVEARLRASQNAQEAPEQPQNGGQVVTPPPPAPDGN